MVKTRLAKDIGEKRACEIYRKMVTSTLNSIPATTEPIIHFAPQDALPEFHDWLGGTYNYQAQIEGDLGARMSHACKCAFEEGADGVILLGGDCPSITQKHLENIASRLEQGKELLGPATDGGYWTMGLRSPFPQVFQHMPWSTPEVANLTRRKFQEHQRPLLEIDTLEDVDDLDSWKRNQHFLT